jgi:NAD(P)-dependent dehydrogenase (short-subunit alcohol dehydrogenase family)
MATSDGGLTSGALLEGKVALITGAGGGLGLQTARLFASEGARVVALDVTDARGGEAVASLRAEGAEVSYRHADVRSATDLEEAVAYAEQLYGHLDVVVANAGILGHSSFQPTEDVSVEDFAAVLDVNLTGAFRTIRAALPALRRAGGGAISVTSSVSGVYATIYRLAYSASKGGLNALVRALAAELAPDRIRVNAVCPGAMATNIRESVGRSPEEIRVPMPDPAVKARLRTPGRDGTAETARIHLFLCSELAAYVSGETLVADGGFSVWNGT